MSPAEKGCAGQYRGDPCPQPVVSGIWCARHVAQRAAMGWSITTMSKVADR